MLAVPADRLPTALADLDPGNRALLDLSLRRGVSDAEIGELLRKTPEEVSRGRDAVLELLADALDVDGHDRRERVRRAVAALPDDAWRAGASAPPPPAREPEEERERPSPAAEGVDDRDDEDRDDEERDDDEREPLPPRRGPDEFYFAPEPRPSRRGGVLAAVGLLAVLGALAAILLGGGDDDGGERAQDDGDRRGSQPAPPPDDGGRKRGKGVALEPLTNARARGRVAPGGDGLLVISISGLPRPDGAYEAWLYDSVVDAKSLGKFENGARTLEGRLPGEASDYRYLDISREPADGNPNHSGESVLRTPLSKLPDR
jgi:hypothetical protein